MASVTYFDKGKRSFTDVPMDLQGEGIETSAFLEAAESLVGLFDLLGATAFSVVQNDMNGNIKKIKERAQAKPTLSKTLQTLVKNETAENQDRATVGMLWLFRGLSFTACGLRRNTTNPNEELSESFNKAYDSTLKKHHSFLIRPVFSLAMKACPYRADFYKKLGEDQVKVKGQLEAWLGALENVVSTMQVFFLNGKFGEF